MRTLRILPLLLMLLALALPVLAQEDKTITITAEGLADPNAEAYQRDKGLMLDDLRNDAKRQILEKAVGSYMETATLMQNYTLVHDKILSRSKGLIRRVAKESQPWVGDDGFAHILMTADVAVGEVKDALGEMGRLERLSLLKDLGNPRISVAINIRDAERGADIKPERSEIAENILKERIKGFGYRVWSDDNTASGQAGAALSGSQAKAADFSVVGEAKFKAVSITLAASKLEVKKYVLTSWSVKCVDNHTGEEIYYNNTVPQKQSWADEDQAIAEIGKLIGAEFSKGFFEEHLQAPASTYQLQVVGLPSYDAGALVRKEFIGLRPVLNVNFRDFDRSGLSLFEVEFTGGRGNFNQFLQSAVLAPLNAKLGEEAFVLDSAHGGTVRILFKSRLNPAEFMARMQGLPPAGLAASSAGRLKDVVKSEETRRKVTELSPETARKLSDGGASKPEMSLDAVKNF